MDDFEEYRKSLVEMQYGDLVNELITLRLCNLPESATGKIFHHRKIAEIIALLNANGLSHGSTKSERPKIRSLKNLL